MVDVEEFRSLFQMLQQLLFTSLSWVVPTSLCTELTSNFIQIFSSAIGVSRWQLVATMKMSR